MKACIRLFSLLIILIPFFSFANVYVHGYVKYPNGTPASSVLVIINSDTAIAQSTCQQSHYRYTNNAGFYNDTLICTGTISQVKTRIGNPCTGTVITHDQVPNANLSVESNFTICDSASNICFSSFTWRDTLNQVFFSSTGYGVTQLDTAISRLWTFGDGTSLSGNVIDPVHTYTTVGSYTVCLKTKTVSGCEKTTCNAVTLTSPSCNAVFNWSRSPAILHRILFNSTASSAVAGDSIVSRKWRFGDGDTLAGNTISPEHTYPGYGTYTACLTIKTRQGCEKTFCYIVGFANPQTNCHAYFSTIYLGATATGYTVKFNSIGSTASYGDSIIQRSWTFGDGTSGTGNDPTHTYAHPGTYTTCLTITSVAGCHDSVCQTVNIPYLHCEAVFSADSISTPAGGNTALHYFKFNSITSHGTTVSDSIISRKWKFGDGDSLTGNVVAPVHGYAQTGTYNVCLYIVTASGCKDTLCKTIIVRNNTSVNCQPRFTTTTNGLLVTFNAGTSTVASGDSIISRVWTLGDGATNTAAVLTHQYPQAGVYNACLTIHTRLGCTATICKLIVVVPVTGNCVPYFTKEQTATGHTIRFNSSAAYSQIPNDSIISRKWEFGDGQILTGNVVNPLHTYLHGGTYTACLTIYTAHCDKRWYQTVQVFPLDSTNTADSVTIVNLYPVPVNSPLYAVLYSSHSNINAQLAIYDVYGMLKWTQSIVLPYGNSTQTIPTAQLAAGPYVFKVTTIYGVKSQTFYKIN